MSSVIHKTRDLKIKLASAIEEILRAEEAERDHVTPAEEFDFVIHTLTDFTIEAVAKYINGSIEHSDSAFLTEVDHGRELRNEQIDSLFYLAALKKRRQQ